MRDKQLQEFINDNKSLFWYTPEESKENISDELLLEMVINYTELDNIMRLFNIIGLNRARNILESFEGRQKNNIYPELYNFFMEYLKRAVASEVEEIAKK
jgi:hypothetical protein